MAVPSAQRSNYGDLFGTAMLPVLEELFRTAFEQTPMLRDQVFKVVAHDRDIWQSSELHDMPLFSQVNEGSDYSFSRPKSGSNKTITPLKYGLGYSISEEAVDDGKFDLIADAISKMGASARESQEQSAMNILNNGFSSQTTPDGIALFGTGHTTPSGSITFRTKLAVDSDLSYTSLQTAIQDFSKQFRGDSGVYKNIRPATLLVPAELAMYAHELVRSDKKTDTNYNNVNTIKDQGLTVRVSPRLTDSNAWFLLAAPSDTGLRIINRKPLETKAAASDSVGWLNDSVYYKARYREAIDVINAYGVFGSPGAT